MSSSSLVVNLTYYDIKSRVIDRKLRENASISFRLIPREHYFELRIHSKRAVDLFITREAQQQSSYPGNVCMWIPNYKCALQFSGCDEVLQQIVNFLAEFQDGKENFNSNNDTNKAIVSTSPPPVGKRSFGTVSKDLFRSGYTPELKYRSTSGLGSGSSKKLDLRGRPCVTTTTTSAPIKKNLFMNLLAAATTKDTPASSTSPQKVPLELTDQQTEILTACLQGRNVFYTGGAGTGKSTLLLTLIERLREVHGQRAVYVAATTGLAACVVGGTTVHQFAGISARLEEQGTASELKAQHDRIVAQACSKPYIQKRIREAKVLLVDEISMMSPVLLEVVNSIAQRVRGDKRPMGGLQVVFCGDFFQLPPVIAQPTMAPAMSTTGTSSASTEARRFCFQSPLWDSLIQASFALQHVHRQSGDDAFIDALNALRRGELTASCREVLGACVGRKLDCADGILPTQIFTHKRDVDQLNKTKLSELPGGTRTFFASDSGDEAYLRMIQSHCPARQQLELKVGAQVILVKTTAMLEGLVNGARGIVTSFAKDSGRPVVKFGDGVERVIGPEVFSVTLGGTVVAQRSQLPLDLSWGISVHKAQGMTVDKAQLHLRNVFEYGQAYVALSRVRTLAGLSLSHALQPAQVKAHPEVVKFYRRMQERELSRQHS